MKGFFQLRDGCCTSTSITALHLQVSSSCVPGAQPQRSSDNGGRPYKSDHAMSDAHLLMMVMVMMMMMKARFFRVVQTYVGW